MLATVRYRIRAMAKPSAKTRRTYRRTFIRQWREYRQLSLRKLADRMVDPETGNRLITAQSIGRIETGLQPYNQGILEALADALRCDVPDLLMRNPTDTESPWSIWESLPPPARVQAVEMLKVIKKTAAG